MTHTSHTPEIVAGIIALLLVAAAIFAVTKKVKAPFSVVLVLVGILLTALSKKYEVFSVLSGLELSPDLILYVFLPTLIFESAFNLDAGQLRRNLGPVLTLAVPGLILSTFLIGFFLHLTTSIPFTSAILLGAILSATDPVAVISLFKRLGAPARLTVLVEGESLFNDATSIVLAKIVVVVVIAGGAAGFSITSGLIDFTVAFAGGLLVGWVLGLLTGYVLGLVESDPFIEITLTTVVAYLSFILAEDGFHFIRDDFHLSGVMAVVGAGITLGGWGRMKISPSVREYLEHFWEYMVFVATALIFLMVGLRVDLHALWTNLDLLLWVLVAMLISRAVVVYGLTPLVGFFKLTEPVGIRYQTVMYWGGLRGAIAIAIVLSLPDFEHRETFVALVMGAVLFTLLVQGITMEPLVALLGLNRPPVADQFARAESALAAIQRALDRIPTLLAGGMFSGPIARRLEEEYATQNVHAREAFHDLRRGELNEEQEQKLAFLQAFSEEKSSYLNLYNKGLLSERAFRQMLMLLQLQIDALRYSGECLTAGKLKRRGWRFGPSLWRLMDRLRGLRGWAERIRLHTLAYAYETNWGHCAGCSTVLKYIQSLERLDSVPKWALEPVHEHFRKQHEEAQYNLDQTAEQYPEFVAATQERLGRRMLLLAEEEALEEEAEGGVLPHSVAETMMDEIAVRRQALKGMGVARLRIEPTELLSKVPFFNKIPEGEFTKLAARMRARSVPPNEAILEQGKSGSSMFLIARGVVRVSHTEEGIDLDLATLMAGDFFGEMALLHDEPRTATVKAVTPCSLYQLNREDMQSFMEAYPAIREALEESDRKRTAELKSVTRKPWESSNTS